jgi:hypothetical protein
MISLSSLKKNLDQKSKFFERYPRDPHVRGALFSTLKTYRKIRKSKMKEYHRKIIDQLDSLLENNPKKYWSLLDDIANKTDNNKIPDITAGTWFDYFSNLNKKTNFSGKDLINYLEAIENEKNYSELDNKITTKEISDAISSLKNNKASSFDSILNEMLKYSQSYILKCLHKLFNSVLTIGIFPTSWAKGIIVPIFKNGLLDDPSNYRGLTIGGNICKLFTKILNTCLDNFLLKRNIVSREQIGFYKGKRTSDHIFALTTLIDKYTQQA